MRAACSPTLTAALAVAGERIVAAGAIGGGLGAAHYVLP